jgi:hypothetical protein
MKTFWDIDGTILLNSLQNPQWDKPSQVHPITGESIMGDMPVYQAYSFLNPKIRPHELHQIRYVITGRPEFRRAITLLQLQQATIRPENLIMFPQPESYDQDVCAFYKAIELENHQAKCYVDDDPDFLLKVENNLNDLGYECE